MPCYLVITIMLKDGLVVKRAAEELGLVEGRDYTFSNGRVSLRDGSKQGALKQRYGVIQAERLARKKGLKSQRRVQEDGTIQLTLQR